MYDEFIPLQPVWEFTETIQEENNEEKDMLNLLQEEKRALLEKVQALESELNQTKSSNKSLLEERNALLREVEKLKSQVQELESKLTYALEEKEKAFKFLSQLEATCLSAVERLKLNAVSEMLDILKKALKEIVNSAYFPHEEVMIKAMSKVFEGSFDIKGSMTIKVNPLDLDLISEFISNLSETWKNKIRVEILEDNNLKVGEFTVETPTFWIERKRDEAIEDALHNVLKNVQDIQ